MTTHRKRRILTVSGAGDVLAGEWARTITGQLYFIKSISEGWATAWNTQRPGHYDIMPVAALIGLPQ